MTTANQPITRLQLEASERVDLVKTIRSSSRRASGRGGTGGGDFRDFERGTGVGARRAGLSISQTADLRGFPRTASSMTWRERA